MFLENSKNARRVKVALKYGYNEAGCLFIRYKRSSSMQKLFLFALVVVMSLTLVACGGETSTPAESETTTSTVVSTATVDLVDVTTEQGVGIKLPASLTKQEENFYADTTTGDSATFTADMADESSPLSDLSQQDFVDFQLSDRTNLVVSSYDNNVTLNGNKALVCKFSFTSAEGNGITGAIVYVNYKGAEYSVSLLYSSDNADSALAQSIDECINSITPTAY